MTAYTIDYGFCGESHSQHRKVYMSLESAKAALKALRKSNLKAYLVGREPTLAEIKAEILHHDKYYEYDIVELEVIS